MTTARIVVTETARLPPPDDDWTAIVKVYLVDDAVDSWHIEAYRLHRRSGPPRRFAAAGVEAPFPAMTERLRRQIDAWLNANRSRVAREGAG